jgi:7-carboxy-7-deazaguanine synthase
MLDPVLASAQPTLSPELTASLVEIFSAIQGEGLNVGTRQIFIRFGICDLRCRFCDSAHTWKPSQTCQIERSPGQRDFVTVSNPVTCQQLLGWVDQPGLHDSISLTGGEPLLHAEFLAQFLPQVRDLALPIYLETAGHLPEQLQLILPYLDTVGMDLKLPSVSGESHWSAHGQFLRRCYDAGVEVFCKLIISEQTQTSDLVQARQLVAAVNPTIPVFLQPVTPLAAAKNLTAPRPEQVLAWQALMKATLKSVRVVPQTHKAIGQL